MNDKMKNLTLLLIFFSYYSLAQDGALDPSFNIGTAFWNGSITQTVTTTSIQSDNKIITGGNFNYFNGINLNPNMTLNLIRLQQDGTIDPSFNYGTGGYSGGSGIYNNLCSAIQTDGKIVVGGDFTSCHGNTKNRIVRLNSDGTIDGSFNIGTGFNNVVKSIIIQTDGKIIVGGRFTSFNGTPINRICRLNTNGTIDFSFNPGTGFNNDVNSIAIQSNGKLLIGGEFSSFNGQPSAYFTRLESNGAIDVSFNVGTGFDQDVKCITIQPNGKILVGGVFSQYQGINTRGIVQINSDGTYDNSFSIGLSMTNSPSYPYGVFDIELQPDGRILLGGYFLYDYQGIYLYNIVRLLPNGNFDTSFDHGMTNYTGFVSPFGYTPYVNTINYLTNDKIIVGGDFKFYNYNDAQTQVNSMVRMNTCSNYSLESINSCEPYNWEGQLCNSSGIYTATFTNSSGCDSTRFLSLTIGSVNNLFTSVSGATITASNSNATYQWLDCNNGYSVISGETNQSFTPSINGSYAVQLTENGCADTTLCVQISNLNVFENSINNIEVFPNPTNGKITLRSTNINDVTEILFYSSQGLLINIENLVSYKESDFIVIDLKGFNSGLYFLKTNETMIKIIVQ